MDLIEKKPAGYYGPFLWIPQKCHSRTCGLHSLAKTLLSSACVLVLPVSLVRKSKYGNGKWKNKRIASII